MAAARPLGVRLPQANVPAARIDADGALRPRLQDLDAQRLRSDYVAQGSFLYVENFLPDSITAHLAAATEAVLPAVNRNYIPRHKQGGSVSRFAIDGLAPLIADLYRSPSLIEWLSDIAGERLQLSPPSDPHAYALYFYTRPGDHIGWHYDTSYYVGRRYTLLFGVVDRSSCRLDYELHTREPGATVQPGSLQMAPGGLVFFDGDKLRHRITPLAPHEVRISLTFEYVTDARMQPWRRVISSFKDAVAYFGFRQVFGLGARARGAARDDTPE